MASKRRQKRRDERLERERRERQCEGKITYDSERTARLSARAIAKKKGEPLVEYRCPYCSKPGEDRYHVGHDPKASPDGLRFPKSP